MGSSNSSLPNDYANPPEIVTCCENNVSIYRCELYVPNESCFYRTTSEATFLSCENKLTPEICEIVKKLKPYHRKHVGDKFQFKACEKCITDEIKKYFTHKPNGWYEEENKNYKYELIKY